MRAVVAAALAALLAAGCGTGAFSTTTPATTFPPSSATTAPGTTVPGGTTSPTAPGEPVADRALLAAIVLFPEDLPDPYRSLALVPADSGFLSAGATLASALEPGDEADDIIDFGLLGEFVVAYGTTEDVWLLVEAAAFSDPTGASGYLADWQEDLARGAAGDGSGDSDLTTFSAAPDETAADEAVRASYSTAGTGPEDPTIEGAVWVARSGATLAWVWAVADDPGAVVDTVGPLVESRLLAVASGEAPARDPALLGLASPPTELLDSFAFEYTYGIDTPLEGAGFTMEVTGRFRGPDRASCDMTYTAGDDQPSVEYLVVVGTRVWLGDFAGYQEVPLRHPSALYDLPLCPGSALFWEWTSYHRLPALEGAAETLDGIAVIREDHAADTAALEALGYSPGQAAAVTRFEVARAVDGGWPMELVVEEESDLAEARRTFGLDPVAAAAGVPATIFTRLRLSRIDDPAISVAPPLAAG